MKQRIRGLVSLHEIPFSSCALQRKDGNCPHYTNRGREGRGEMGEMEAFCKNLYESIVVFDVSPTLLCMAAAPPVTSHLSIQEAVLFLSLFGKEEEEGGRGGGE